MVGQAVLIEKHGAPDSLCHILHSTGTFEGHIRTFYMGTVNQNDFPNYYALAMGGGLGYYSPIIKGFQVGLSGFIIYNLSSSHLGTTAPYANRYEVGLFDVENPDNHEDLDRLEDLYVRYYFTQKNKSFVQYGKFHMKSPLINLQDGRMRPNLQEGIWTEWNDWKQINVKAGWINRTSPRSTVRWMDVGESLIYGNGRAVSGRALTILAILKVVESLCWEQR
jgi:outer membrane porin, OprD family.